MGPVHVMTKIIEKSYEYNIDLSILFTDFKQAFDRINKEKIN